MHQTHVGGERNAVDYAGLKIPLVNPETGEVSPVPVFVAVLPASNYTYAEAQSSENQCNWNNGHSGPLRFLGCGEDCRADNLKTGVSEAQLYEPDINRLTRNWRALPICVLPTRVKSPRTKAKLRTGSKCGALVIAPLRKCTFFFSLAEINQAIREQLDQLNNKVMFGGGRSRRQEFEDIDAQI